MIPFDGEFAVKTVLPLAATAYSATWNVHNDPVLAAMTRHREILVDTSDPEFLGLIRKSSMSGISKLVFARMRKPGAGFSTGVAAPVSFDGESHFDAPTVAVNDRFGWVCRRGNCLVITLRGSHTAADWLDNFDFIAEPYLPVPGQGTVHQGFQLAYYAIRKNLLALVEELKEGTTELLVVGHSLGGAIATLLIPDLLNGPLQNVSPMLYNLASPRAGHDDFQNFFDSRVKVCYRIANQWDVVPHLPPTLAGYVHVGSQLIIDSGFNCDIAVNHVLDTGYKPGLASWQERHGHSKSVNNGAAAPHALVGVSA